MTIPANARERLTASLSAEHLHRLSPIGVPVSERVWHHGCRVARNYAEAAVEAVLACMSDSADINATALQRSAAEAQVRAEAFARSLWILSCLTSETSYIVGCRASLATAINALASYLRDGAVTRASASSAAAELLEGVDRLARAPYCGSPHPLADLLRLDPGAELDSRGQPSVSRVLAAFYLHYDRLEDLIHPVVRGLTERPLGLLTSVELAVGILGSANAFITLEATAECIERAARDVARGGTSVSEALKAAVARQDQAAFSLGQIAVDQARLARAESEGELASGTLNVYRRIIEGHLRPAAWFLISLDRPRAAKVPGLTPLGTAITASGGMVSRVWNESVQIAVRNAGAHEDFVWDTRRGVLRFEGGEATLTSLQDAIETAQAFVSGVGLARDALPWLLGDRIGVPGINHGLDSEFESYATTLFGTNGLLVQRITIERSTFRAVLDRLRQEDINPCLQALTYGSRWVREVERFQVFVGDAPAPLIDVDRAALDATFAVWRDAVGRFPLTPLSTFLAANWSARSHAEKPMRAARSAAWIAADDALDAWISLAGGAVPAHRELLEARLQLIDSSIAALLPLVEERHRLPLIRVRSLTAGIGRSDATSPSGLLRNRTDSAVALLEDLHEFWSPVPRLPAVPGS